MAKRRPSEKVRSLVLLLGLVMGLWSAPGLGADGVAAGPAQRHARRHREGVAALAVSPDGKLVAATSDDKRIRLLDAETGHERLVLRGHLGADVTGMVFIGDGSHLVSVGRDSEIRMWDTASGQQAAALHGHEAPINAIAASPDGRLLASAGEESRIMLWDAHTGKMDRILLGHTDFVNGLAFSRDSELLASGDADGSVLVWNVATGDLRQALLGHASDVNAVAYSPDGRFLASAGDDTRVILWDAATGQQHTRLEGHTQPVRTLAFSGDGQRLASASEDGRIIVWNVTTSRPSTVLSGAAALIDALAFTPGGTALVSGSEDNDVTFWDPSHAKKRRVLTLPANPHEGSSKAVPGDKGTVFAVGARLGAPVAARRAADVAVRRRAPRTCAPPEGGPYSESCGPSSLLARLWNWLGPAAAEAQSNPNQGPGGPILVITSSSSTYGTFYAEILRTEGLNAFAVTDMSTVTAATLASYDVVILATMPLTAGQVTMFNTWVTGGGNLIAMRPDVQLAGLLGLTAAGTTLSNAYLVIDTSTAPGNGLVHQTIQFHGTADRYTLSGATSLATLYSNATTATANPAVTWRSVGSNGGRAAAVTYDLATSVVYTRQGNPTWAAQERDGVAPIRSDDKFYGAASGDPQPDWIDLTKVAIPQADEQQRLLANLILEMNAAKRPLPRFWYFPHDTKAVIVMTGDDHGNGGTAGRFDQFVADSPAGCRVANWECVRGTSYIYVETQNLTPTQAANYTAQGFEVGLHVNTNCADFTPSTLNTFYAQQVSGFKSAYPNIPGPITQRHHCIAWSDWVTGAKTELSYGMRLDTSYYYWPPSWIQDVPGVFTGSAMPMRFADLDGTLVDVYQATSQMTDESGQSYPFTVDTLLDRAVGAEGYYGAYTVNAHTDEAASAVSDAVVSSALARGVPIVSSLQMLSWLDGRNSSSFGSITWNGSALGFTVTQGAGASGLLQAMVPAKTAGGSLASLTRGGSPVTFIVETVKGRTYASFPASAGTFVATYAPDTTPPTVRSTAPASGATGVAAASTVKATFSEPLDPTTVTASTFVLRDPTNAPVAATVTYDPATTTATLTPSGGLAGSSTYSATVTRGVTDVAGNPLAANVAWAFTTAAGPTCPCSGWSSSTTPTTPSSSDTSSVELGVKFKSDVSGFISGIRFYKSSGNTGTHTGTLWSGAGLQLATATFSGETASGWQQVNFATPVAITANTVYVASYHAPDGHYAADSLYFANSGVDTGPVHLLSDPVAGGNGVYAYGSGTTFPSSAYQATNYWVDVVLATSGSTPTATSVPAATPTVTPSKTTGMATATPTATLTGTAPPNPCAAPANAIVAENCLAGNPASEWDIGGAGDASIQGFATDISVNRGGTVSFKVNTNAANFRLDIYRMGYYGGMGARKVATVTPSAALPQNQPNCLSNAATGLIDCGNWAVSASWTVPANATSGIYFARLVRTDTQGASHIVFVVRDDASTSDLLFQTSDTTWQAYNQYGGNSLYVGSPAGRAYKVSYNRPITTRATSAEDFVFNAEYPMVRWLESNGYSVSYFTGVDAERNGALIKNHKVWMSNGHDEYWSGGERTNVTAARDAGVHLAFFSGNTIFWKTRWENSIDGSATPYRTLVCYKETHANAVIDPADPPTWTGTWRDPRFSPPADGGRPENALKGTIFRMNGGQNGTISVPQATGRMRFWRNTAVAALGSGQTASLAPGTIGAEFDDDEDNGFRPAGLFEISSTSISDSNNYLLDYGSTYGAGTAVHKATLYKAPSRAWVFAAGTYQWAWGLDANHDRSTLGSTTNAAMQQATVNLFADMGVQPATLRSGLVSATPSIDASAPSSTIASPAKGAIVAPGSAVTISGTAADTGGGVVAAVEVSVDGGATWHPASGREAWSYGWTASGSGSITIKSRAVDDSGNIETPGAGDSITIGSPAPGSATTIWGPTATPANAADPDAAAVELGVRFTSDVTGSITGIRFYKSTANTGTHTGALWSNTGTLLATATFSGESASGWQQVNFTTPVVITAGTVYVASYHASTGHYAGDTNYFATAGVDNPPLHALRDGASGANGVYVYGASAFPTNTYQSTNYWVDVVFSAAAAPTATATARTSATSTATSVPTSKSTATAGPSATSTATKPPTATSTATTVATRTPTVTIGPSRTPTRTAAATATPSATPTPTPTATAIPAILTIWGPSTTPANPADDDPSPVELGVRFTSDVNGRIIGIRFYKSPANTGTHTGTLWSNTGTLLATATFAGETASGWQQVNFASPVAITAGAVYVASYHCTVGHYAGDNNYFAAAGVDNPPLHALRDGVSGANGVYVYGASAFPANAFQSSNYWVDVIFSPGP